MHSVMDFDPRELLYIVALFCWIVGTVTGFTDPDDFRILNDLRNGLDNPELLRWPARGNDPCGPPAWSHVFCSNGRVTQIQVQGLGLQGPLPQNLNKLDKLQNVGLQRNKFSGKLPSFSGLSNLQYAYLDNNNFDTIPADFFSGLSSIRTLALDNNNFNRSSGWSIPSDLGESSQLVNFSCSRCNIVGPLPDFFGSLASLTSLKMSYNQLNGGLPSSLANSNLQILWLNNQDGNGMSGSIDVISTMVGLTQVWLHGNKFTGSIPDNIGNLTSLRDLNLNHNQLVGLIPLSLANLSLQSLDLNNNMFTGPIPKFRAVNVTYASNSFCQSNAGQQCAPEVSALLDFLQNINYPASLASQWTGNDPCNGPWLGITCNAKKQVSIINLPKRGLNGTLSTALVNLPSLLEIRIGGNSLHGVVPASLAQLKLLRLLDISGNNFSPPLPRFGPNVKVITSGNPKLVANSPNNGPLLPHSPDNSPLPSPGSKSTNPSSDYQPPPSDTSPSPSGQRKMKSSKSSKGTIIAVAATGSTVLTLMAAFGIAYCLKKRKEFKKAANAAMIKPKGPFGTGNKVKIAVADGSALEAQTGSGTHNTGSSGLQDGQLFESGSLVFSAEVLRNVTNNFAQENELGRGGFGAVYKGELEDGTKIAVKRMEAGVLSSKAVGEFQAEIAVLSKVRHRHLVSLLGYCIEGNERLLVYEYMPQGALSRHLFRWKSHNLKPLSWTTRLTIALDVARGMEYLHILGHQSFIHRDLKSANILLDDVYRAKVADFGLVKLAPDRGKSVATRLAGTFGYLAPEYAVTGKITTKVDVFSYGVVLMELLTGLVALDEDRSEESRYLAEWFWNVKTDNAKLITSIDPALSVTEDIYESIYVIAELAGHCTARDPNHRPEMGHVVNVLVPLVEKWKPFEETDRNTGVEEEYSVPLAQMLMGWKETDPKGVTSKSVDSTGSLPTKPSGFAEAFEPDDGR